MRDLSISLVEALDDVVRHPDYRIYAFDIKVDSYTKIIDGTYTQEPLDLTDFVSDISWNLTDMKLTLRDEDGRFHPDTGAMASYLKDGCVLRLREGDDRVDQEHWPWTFTGAIKGQIGWQVSARGEGMQSTLTVFSREATQSYNRRSITTTEYTMGTDLGVMAKDIANSFMGLSEEEYRIPHPLGWVFHHKVNQIAQQNPMEALKSILEVMSMVPWFDGEGKLRAWTKELAHAPIRVLPDNKRVFAVEIPPRVQDYTNKVIVTFLDSVLEEVEGKYQRLGTAEVTTGFFTMEENLDCWWSDDKKQRAKGTNMRVIKSVNDNLLPVGSESYSQIDEFHGRIHVQISSWVPILATVMVMEYLLAALIPDRTSMTTCTIPGTGGFLMGEGCGAIAIEGVVIVNPTTFQQFTIPWGRVLQAQAMMAITLIMMSLGSAQYEIWGTPYDLAYLEKQSIAVEDGIEYWQENEKEIKNDFIGTFEQADSVSVTELIFLRSQVEQRTLTIDDDLALEPGDIVQVPDGRQFFIEKMSKTIRRGELPKLKLEGFKVMTA